MLEYGDWEVFGLQLCEVGQYKKALYCFEQMADSGPEPATMNACAAYAAARCKEFDLADKYAKMAIAKNPKLPMAWFSLGVNAHGRNRDYRTAIKHYKHALQLQPNYDVARNNLAMAYLHTQKWQDAIDTYEAGIIANPMALDLRFFYAMTKLLVGDWDAGFEHYETRLAIPGGNPLPMNGTPIWTGESLKGKHLVIYAEQGIGDAIQFSRFAKNVQACFSPVAITVVCRQELSDLMRRVPYVKFVWTSQLAHKNGNMQVAMLSIPGILHKKFGVVYTGGNPYISTSKLRRRTGTKRIGLCWAGRPGHTNDEFRSMSLSEIRQGLFASSKVQYHSLQFGIQPEKQHLFMNMNDISTLDKLADEISQMSLVITVDTSVAHLAGAMGVPVWILLPATGDWRWGTEGTKTPWYKSARLFRQKKLGDWKPVLREVKKALKEKYGN